ncbi:MAG TPA: amidohydrolase family protein [Sphingomonadaceae bacterium]|nr:amidohydrolase family protein [Sphingomonadaceae bacterium]
MADMPKRLIAAEEGFALPEIQAATRTWLQQHPGEEPGLLALMQGFGPEQSRRWFAELVDFAGARESAMNMAGITTQVLLHGSPGVQIFDADEGSRLAALANDRMAEVARRDPRRYAPLTTIAPQAPEKAARELERGMRRLGLHGGLINSHTKGEYLDEPKFWPILEAAEALGAPLYLHPREPAPAMVRPFVDHSLVGPIWGFAADTGLHALRLIMAGVFDRFPKLQIVLGHLGEGLPFFIDRIDIRYRVDGSPGRVKLKRWPSDYLKTNFHLTTSGMNWAPAVEQSIAVMGADRILFAADWPFEDATDAAQRFRALPLGPEQRDLIAYRNAERLFHIAPL